jgi:hypothetical protein
MTSDNKDRNFSDEYHLRVYRDRSELYLPDGTSLDYREGQADEATKARYAKIDLALKNGFLSDAIDYCNNHPESLETSSLSIPHRTLLDKLVESMTSEVGRAIIGLTVLQLTIKAIEPSQDIRLHKGGGRGGHFGWRSGVSMRTLDKQYITPTLRANGLLKLNADGFMMTRSLAENYPYSQVYKAAIRGSRKEWLCIVDALENRELSPMDGLRHLLVRLLNQAEKFKILCSCAVEALDAYFMRTPRHRLEDTIEIVKKHIYASTYAARIMEVAMHSLFQGIGDLAALNGIELVRLSQMRSANKKHGNIGDIELTLNGKIIEAWDAKYGKSYLRDELEELYDKIRDHDSVETVGFVTSEAPDFRPEILSRLEEIHELTGIAIKVVTFDEWAKSVISQYNINDSALSKQWLLAYTESLSQKRTGIAPIDEPCAIWLAQWIETLNGSPE